MIILEHVNKQYIPGVNALEDINIRIEDGEFVFVVGASGSGKSTLMKLLTKELDATSGKITVNGRKLEQMKRRHIPYYRRDIGCVYQDFRLLRDKNVYDNVAFAQRVVSASGRSIKRNVPKVLSLVGLAAKYRSKPNQLSGGEQQRVAIARALVNNPKILLADEPTGNLDPRNSWEIMKLLEEINRRGTTVLVVSHNAAIVEEMKKRVIELQMGHIISDTRPQPEQGAQQIPPVQGAQPIPPVQATQPIPPVQATQPTPPVQPTQSNPQAQQPAQPIPPVQATQPIPPVQGAQPIPPVQPTQPNPQVQPTQQTTSAQPAQPTPPKEPAQMGGDNA